MYFQLFGQFKKTLRQLDTWLEKGAQYAAQKKFDPNSWLEFRLAPDALSFARQVQITCDTAKLGAARLTGKEAPKHDDNEKTLDELRARVASVIAYLDTFTEKDFAESATRSVTQPRWEGKTMTGANYFIEHVVPNFFFHATTVYQLLRHNGVDVGKKDYLGALTMSNPS